MLALETDRLILEIWVSETECAFVAMSQGHSMTIGIYDEVIANLTRQNIES